MYEEQPEHDEEKTLGKASEPYWSVDYGESIAYIPRTRVALSWTGYVLFGVIVYASYKGGVLRKRMHDVLLTLTFALVVDFLEMGQNIFFIINIPDNGSLATTATACTLASWLFNMHYFIAVIEMFVTIHRFIVCFCEKLISVWLLYFGIGIYLFISTTYFVATFLFGTIELGGIGFCKGSYVLSSSFLHGSLTGFMLFSAITFTLSALMIIKGFSRKQSVTGVTLFLLISSIFYVVMVVSTITGLATGIRSFNILPYRILTGTMSIEYSRFSILCLVAVLVVVDIRGAVRSTVTDAVRKMLGRKKVSFLINYDATLVVGEKNKLRDTEDYI